MSFNFEKFSQQLTGSVSEISNSISPFAKRTQQIFQEAIGQVEEKTQLPEEYLELEHKVDNLKQVYNKLLSVSSQFDNESYDYPPNLKESFTDFSKTLQKKVSGLSNVQSADDFQRVLMTNEGEHEKKTLYHALSRAAKPAVPTTDETDPLSVGLLKFSAAEEKIGENRLQQDALISTKFNKPLQSTLQNAFKIVGKARKNVYNSRLNLDALKNNKKSNRIEIEQAEDDFIAATEEAVSVMKNLLKNSELLKVLSDFVAAQLNFYKSSVEVLNNLLPEIDDLNTEE